MNACIASTGSSVLQHVPDGPWYLIQTPLGYSLNEVEDQLDSDPLSPTSMPNFLAEADSWGTHKLMAEDSSTHLYWLRDNSREYVDLQSLSVEYVVTIYGYYQGDDSGGTPIMEAQAFKTRRVREIVNHGTITLVDRGADGEVCILVDDGGDAWDLLGTVADEMAGLPGIEGAGTTITGSSKLVSSDSQAGGLLFSVISYVLDSEIKPLITEALNNLIYPGGSKITYLTIELKPGSTVEGSSPLPYT